MGTTHAELKVTVKQMITADPARRVHLIQVWVHLIQVWVCYLCDLLEVVVAFLQRSRSVQRLPHTAVFVQEHLTVLLHPVQHLRDRWVERDRKSSISSGS